MFISSIKLQNFRSYEEQEFEFSKNATVIVGPNGAGKTNLLEAVYVLLSGKSFRGSDEDLIKYDNDWWKITGRIDDHEREIRYKSNSSPPKQLILNGSPKGRFTYRHQLPVVLFEPNHLLMVHGSPSLRRSYLDELLIKIDPVYRSTLSRYERILAQRNSLLKQGLSPNTLHDAVFAWDITLAEYGTEIMKRRAETIELINKNLNDEYSRIADKEQTLNIVYMPSVATTRFNSSVLAESLSRRLEEDARRGFTSIGPHRDDIEFVLNGQSAKSTASRGEVRTLVLTLKNQELDILEKTKNISPIYLLDDIFSELDKKRRDKISTQSTTQRIITSQVKVKITGQNSRNLSIL